MFGKTNSFFKETRQELNKVTWPERNELISSSVVVIVTTFLLALFIGAIDFVLSILVRVIIR
ncbi:MAG: preprotein translocase subunit SecE [Candidatus Omnitrophica bacterium]|nr:preprotein translocase subunit SecE [Candidatus Omnitrophota bacterium]